MGRSLGRLLENSSAARRACWARTQKGMWIATLRYLVGPAYGCQLGGVFHLVCNLKEFTGLNVERLVRVGVQHKAEADQ
jgi:hypothetical protein